MYNMGIVHYRDPERRFDSVVRVIVKIFKVRHSPITLSWASLVWV